MKQRQIRRYHRLLKWGRTIQNQLVLLAPIVRWFTPLFTWLKKGFWLFTYINPRRYLKVLDWYIIRKFIGTYFFSITLIISISIVFDANENLAKFAQFHAPFKAIVFDY